MADPRSSVRIRGAATLHLE